MFWFEMEASEAVLAAASSFTKSFLCGEANGFSRTMLLKLEKASL